MHAMYTNNKAMEIESLFIIRLMLWLINIRNELREMVFVNGECLNKPL